MSSIEISRTIYKFIDENIHLYDLQLYNQDTSINRDNILQYSREQICSSRYMNFLEKIYSNATYISCNDVIRILNSNITEINRLVYDEGYIPILIFPKNDSFKKSNVFFTGYFLSRFPRIRHMYYIITDLLENGNIKSSEKDLIDKRILIIICDDITYSGKQLSGYINPINLGDGPSTALGEGGVSCGTSGPVNLNPNIRIYLNLIGYTSNAKNRCDKEVKNSEQLIYPVSSVSTHPKFDDIINQLATTARISSDDLIKRNDLYILRKNRDNLKVSRELFTNSLKKETQYLTYPFFKYPDATSTVSYLCRIETYNDNIYTLNFENIPRFDYTTIPNKKEFDLNQLVPTDIYNLILQNYDSITNSFDIESLQRNNINFIIKCNNVNNQNILKTSNGNNWIKTINNCKYESFKGEKRIDYNGDCDYDRQGCITTFYKNLIYMFNGSSVDKSKDMNTIIDAEIIKNKQIMDKINDDAHKARTIQYREKYLKYKAKYLNLLKKIEK